MEQKAYTAGPWHVDADPFSGGDSAVFARNGHGHPVWIARVYRVMGNAQRNADAALIASAPDLAREVEQLRAENARLRETVRIYANQSIGPDWTPEQALGFIKQHARAALASDARTEGGA